MKRYALLVLAISIVSFATGRVSAQAKPVSGLKRTVGEYVVDGTIFFGPGQPGAPSKGKAKYSEVLGGRFVRQEYTATVMGAPVKGIGYLGYDAASDTYSSVWMYNMSPRIQFMQGQKGKDGVITLVGDAGNGMKREQTLRWTDEKTRVMEAWLVRPDGAKSKVYKLTYKKQG